MKSYIVFNQQGVATALPTEDAAKDHMRKAEGAYNVLHIDVGSGREALCAFFNRQFPPEMILKQVTFDFTGTQLRERK